MRAPPRLDRRGRAARPPAGLWCHRRGAAGPAARAGLAATLILLLWTARGLPASPTPHTDRRPVADEAEVVVGAVRAAVPEFRPTPTQWFRVKFLRRITLLGGAKVFAVSRLTVPETHGYVGLAPDGRSYLLGSDWKGPCAAEGFNALVDPLRVHLETPGGAAAFARAYIALMHIDRARVVERLEDLPDPGTDAYREYEDQVTAYLLERYKGLIRPVLREPSGAGSTVSFYLWLRTELQRWELTVSKEGRVTACSSIRVAGTPSTQVR